MKTNKDMIRSAMDRRLSFLDGLPSCRAGVLEQIAREEAPVMKKKVSVGLVFAIVLVLLSVAALAAGILFSRGADAARIADRALEEKYGVTQEMQTYFYREEEEQPDGAVCVTYTGKDDLEYVLGTYTAYVKDGKAEVAWSHDGEDTAGGYEAEAWGAEQLKEMMAWNSAQGNMDAFRPQAVAIAEKHNAAWKQEIGTDEEKRAYFEQLEKEKTAALEARKIPEETMKSAARDAVIQTYELSAEQAALLELYVQPLAVEENAWYHMYEGKPCFEVQYFLDQDPEHTETHVEKDGTYAALINVETGVIEKLVYESGLGGEG